MQLAALPVARCTKRFLYSSNKCHSVWSSSLQKCEASCAFREPSASTITLLDAPDAITLRRMTAGGRWINFHTDTAARTVQVSAHWPLSQPSHCTLCLPHASQTQVPLADDGECEGGLLLFACSDGRLMHVQRRVGSIMAHDGDAVHGATQLVKGIRCKLLDCCSFAKTV